jgi:transposase
MVIMPEAFPVEFRRDVVAVARKGEAPLSQMAKISGYRNLACTAGSR